nr:peroxidase 4-like isoform X3 [Ipomoea trifida]
MAVAIVLIVAVFLGNSSAQLSTKFYSKSCPMLFGTIKSVIKSSVNKEKRMGASLLRLHFHDCFVQGCDGSILLDDTSSFKGEKTAFANNNSVRGYDVIDDIKSAIEKVCPGVVSCADIVAIAARDSTVLLGGPNWKVKLGRRDSKTASLSAANSPGVLPSPSSNLSALISSFKNQGLSTRDLVALSVEKYSENPALFNSHFAKAMIKMGNIRPLTGSSGEIRKNCRKAN